MTPNFIYRKQEETQFLGFFGILKEAVNITILYRKIFSQITLSTILPLSFIFFAHDEISEFLFGDFIHNEHALNVHASQSSNILSFKWATYWLFTVSFYFIFLQILCLISTSAVIYTIACIYTSKDITYKKLIKVVPIVWKRLIVTFIWSLIIGFSFYIFIPLVLILWSFTFGPSNIHSIVGTIFLLLNLSWLLYYCILWHLASVISVLEDVYGIQALFKSKDLIKGKFLVYAAILLINRLCIYGVEVKFEASFVGRYSVWGRMLYSLFWYMLPSVLILFGLVVQTMIYFICKSYHHENIDKTSLADRLENYNGDFADCLEIYNGDYVPLESH